MKSLFQATRGRRLEKQTGGIDWNLDLMSMKVEELREREDEQSQEGKGLTGLGIRVLSEKESTPFKFERQAYPLKGRQFDNGDDSDTVSVTSTCPDLDLTPIVDAFPAPPTPTSSSPSFPSSSPTLYPPHTTVSPPLHYPRSPPRTLTFDYHPQLQHRPSISTISSELTLASTISTNSSIETPSPQTPNASEMLPVAIPRPNAANLRRVRSFAKPVSVYFSPDRPPALPLPVREISQFPIEHFANLRSPDCRLLLLPLFRLLVFPPLSQSHLRPPHALPRTPLRVESLLCPMVSTLQRTGEYPKGLQWLLQIDPYQQFPSSTIQHLVILDSSLSLLLLHEVLPPLGNGQVQFKLREVALLRQRFHRKIRLQLLRDRDLLRLDRIRVLPLSTLDRLVRQRDKSHLSKATP